MALPVHGSHRYATSSNGPVRDGMTDVQEPAAPSRRRSSRVGARGPAPKAVRQPAPKATRQPAPKATRQPAPKATRQPAPKATPQPAPKANRQAARTAATTPRRPTTPRRAEAPAAKAA